jgi:DNA (cytosine-5)-methyltransferase 1
MRTSPDSVPKWLDRLGKVKSGLVENVPNFVEWGPLDENDRPIPHLKGTLFRKWLQKIDRCGFDLDWKILNCADYGDATTRKRFFLMYKKRGHKISWPDHSHTEDTWRPARDIIDWNLRGGSIFTRRRPLKPRTLARIQAGLEKFCAPFLTMLYGTAKVRSLDQPLPTITAKGEHIALCEFILQQQSGGAPRNVSDPLPTIAAKGAQALVQSYLIPFFGEREGQEPRTHDLNNPLPAVTGHGAGGLVTPMPFIISAGGPEGQGRNPKDIGLPLGTIMTEDHKALVLPLLRKFMIRIDHASGGNSSARLVDLPLGTIIGQPNHALIEPFLLKYYGTGISHSLSEPVPTITSKDRMGLVVPQPMAYGLDILFRMLQPHELAAAMSFREGYQFSGNRGDQVRQIGNAVPVRTAKALCQSLLAS